MPSLSEEVHTQRPCQQALQDTPRTKEAVTQVETIFTLWDPKNDAIAFQVGTPPEMFGLP